MEVRCPRCGMDFVRRVRREGLAEIVASVAYLYPFTCQLCAHRFRAFQWGVRPTEQPIDQRHYERVQVSFPLSFSTDTGLANGAALDLSMSGCAFKTAPAPGDIVQLQLRPQDWNAPSSWTPPLCDRSDPSMSARSFSGSAPRSSIA